MIKLIRQHDRIGSGRPRIILTLQRKITGVLIRWPVWTSPRVIPDCLPVAHSNGPIQWVTRGHPRVSQNCRKTTPKSLSEVLLDHSPGHQDSGRSDLGVLRAIEIGGCHLDSPFQFSIALKVECWDAPEHCFLKGSIFVLFRNHTLIAVWSWPGCLWPVTFSKSAIFHRVVLGKINGGEENGTLSHFRPSLGKKQHSK